MEGEKKLKFRQDSIFAIIVAGIVGILLFKAFQYGPQTRLALVGTGIPLLFLLLLYIIQGFFPNFSGRFNRMFRGITHSHDKNENQYLQLSDLISSIHKKEYIVILWLLVLVAMIILFGLLASLPIFILFFMRFYGSEAWGFSIVIAGCAFLFIYLAFFLLLKLNFYNGILYSLLT